MSSLVHDSCRILLGHNFSTESSLIGNERQRTSANVSERQRTPTNANERQRTPTNANERQRTLTNVNERQRTPANHNERRRTSACRCGWRYPIRPCVRDICELHGGDWTFGSGPRNSSRSIFLTGRASPFQGTSRRYHSIAGVRCRSLTFVVVRFFFAANPPISCHTDRFFL